MPTAYHIVVQVHDIESLGRSLTPSYDSIIVHVSDDHCTRYYIPLTGVCAHFSASMSMKMAQNQSIYWKSFSVAGLDFLMIPPIPHRIRRSSMLCNAGTESFLQGL